MTSFLMRADWVLSLVARWRLTQPSFMRRFFAWALRMDFCSRRRSQMKGGEEEEEEEEVEDLEGGDVALKVSVAGAGVAEGRGLVEAVLAPEALDLVREAGGFAG